MYRGTYSGDVVAIKTVFPRWCGAPTSTTLPRSVAPGADPQPRFVRLYGIALKGPIVHVVTEYVDHTLLEWFEKSAPGPTAWLARRDAAARGH